MKSLTERSSVLIYGEGGWLCADKQAKLLQYAQAGGNLVLIGSYPRLDEEFNSGWFYRYQKVPGEPVVVERIPYPSLTAEEMELLTGLPAGERYLIGYTQPAGQGRITFLGLEPSAELLIALHAWLGIAIPSRVKVKGVTSAL